MPEPFSKAQSGTKITQKVHSKKVHSNTIYCHCALDTFVYPIKELSNVPYSRTKRCQINNNWRADIICKKNLHILQLSKDIDIYARSIPASFRTVMNEGVKHKNLNSKWKEMYAKSEWSVFNGLLFSLFLRRMFWKMSYFVHGKKDTRKK